MRTPEFLSELQAARLRSIRQAMDRNLRQADAARAMNIAAPHLGYIVKQFTGTSKWPPDPALVAALLALPVLDERAARQRRGKAAAETVSQERTRAEMVAAKREDAARSREDHERFWLEQEQAKYNLPRPGRPLSSMPI